MPMQSSRSEIFWRESAICHSVNSKSFFCIVFPLEYTCQQCQNKHCLSCTLYYCSLILCLAIFQAYLGLLRSKIKHSYPRYNKRPWIFCTTCTIWMLKLSTVPQINYLRLVGSCWIIYHPSSCEQFCSRDCASKRRGFIRHFRGILLCSWTCREIDYLTLAGMALLASWCRMAWSLECSFFSFIFSSWSKICQRGQ